MTWKWVILVLGLALIYAVLFCVAVATVANVAVKWTKAMVTPYRPQWEPPTEEPTSGLDETAEFPLPPDEEFPRKDFK